MLTASASKVLNTQQQVCMQLQPGEAPDAQCVCRGSVQLLRNKLKQETAKQERLQLEHTPLNIHANTRACMHANTSATQAKGERSRQHRDLACSFCHCSCIHTNDFRLLSLQTERQSVRYMYTCRNQHSPVCTQAAGMFTTTADSRAHSCSSHAHTTHTI